MPGVACLLCGVAFRIGMGWHGITDGRLQYAQMALGQLAWYATGLLLIALHLGRSACGAGVWAGWGVGVLAAGAAVLSSCPP
jgi:hypothetical protein